MSHSYDTFTNLVGYANKFKFNSNILNAAPYLAALATTVGPSIIGGIKSRLYNTAAGNAYKKKVYKKKTYRKKATYSKKIQKGPSYGKRYL